MITSEIIGRSFLQKSLNQEIDGHIEINYCLYVKEKKEVNVEYKIFNDKNELKFSNVVNIYSIPYDVILYIIYETAKLYNITKPSNFITDNNEFSTCGIAQPNLDQKMILKYKDLIEKFLVI